jgi:hypothetical protein
MGINTFNPRLGNRILDLKIEILRKVSLNKTAHVDTFQK